MAAIAINGHHMATAEASDESVANYATYDSDGRRLTFRLEVIQHPQRARACGSGAKSSADRRPVDPPPVVQLRIYEGANAENDITMTYLASFFIFVSLENSKKVEPRPANAAPLPLPVLTGTNVCSINYLERPDPAGYFIFPDLSVRHEGDYRMVFALYQELYRGPGVDSSFQNTGVVQSQEGPYLKQLATVRSNPFNVFSAKKFPGLMESTALSRQFAEQGVRVRIRRDVRMRRRGKNDADHGDEEPAPVPGEIAPHPKVEAIDRSRSHSVASQAISRRPSMEQISQGFASAQRSPMTPHAPVGGFGEAPTWVQPASVVAHQTSFMHPPAAPASYPQAPYQPQYPTHSQGFVPPPQPQHYGSISHSRHNSIEIPQPPTGPSQYTPNYMAPGAQYNHTQQPMPPYIPAPVHRNSMAQGHGLQPINTTHQVHHAEVSPNAGYANAPMQSPANDMYEYPPQQVHRSQPQLHQPQPQQYANFAAMHPPPRIEHQPQTNGAMKRTFSATFDAGHLDARLQHGERPASPAIEAGRLGSISHGIAPASVEEDAEQDAFISSQMCYRRADGNLARRQPRY